MPAHHAANAQSLLSVQTSEPKQAAICPKSHLAATLFFSKAQGSQARTGLVVLRRVRAASALLPTPVPVPKKQNWQTSLDAALSERR